MLAHFSCRSVSGQSYDTQGGFDPSQRTQTLSWGPAAAQCPVSMVPPGVHLRNMQLKVLVWVPLSPYSKQPGTCCLTPGPLDFHCFLSLKAVTPSSAVTMCSHSHLNRLFQVSSTLNFLFMFIRHHVNDALPLKLQSYSTLCI